MYYTYRCHHALTNAGTTPKCIFTNSQEITQRSVMTASTKAKLIRIRVEEDPVGLFYATSPELKGLLVAKHTLRELEDDIPRAITELYAVCGVKVVVSRLEDGEGGYQPWVAFPAEVAKRALEVA